jgi:hypothetical protein
VTGEGRRIAAGEVLEQGAINETTRIPNLCQSSAIDDHGMRTYDFLIQGSNSQMRIRAGIPAALKRPSDASPQNPLIAEGAGKTGYRLIPMAPVQ